jgi:hypothetical protein
MSVDGGKTWKANRTVTKDRAGQGHGNVAANGNIVMMVWPDMRDGLHLRYRLIEVK